MDSDEGQPLQIVSTGEDEDKNEFILLEDNIERILNKIPAGTKVAILSVVGAFRSGKSFLLTFFLRYLRHGSSDDLSTAWMTASGDALREGNVNEKKSSPEEGTGDLKGFAWCGGQSRQTTGIWMWSEPFLRKVSSHPEKIAILLMDTQGMFDNETTMTLTAQIFGLSTMISSYQIYNVDKRIQEDNLQHLALFSEYGRMALGEQNTDTPADDVVNEVHDDCNTENETEDVKPDTNVIVKSPFQRIEFLVRDWQNFDTDWEDALESGKSENEVFKAYHSEMMEYLHSVIKSRGASDLQSTRDQISRCFEKVGCFLLPHPGFHVIKKNYAGDIEKIEASFRGLLNHYVRFIFDTIIEPKRINNRSITGPELLNFIKAYAAMFEHDGSCFPKAMTMLEATADANNRNAYDMAIKSYKSAMDAVAGPEGHFVKESNLNVIHKESLQSALSIFNEIAEMGSEVAIGRKRTELLDDIEKERKRYFDSNAYRNPFRNVEFFALPLIIATLSWILAVIVDSTCSTDICERAEDGFQNIYLFIFFGFLVVAWRHVIGSW
eukprot:CAMPEP_0185020938 /NCGR_PEP_ID=MMETSP1103-20130426/3584_1 /TAXON_ID=36769 /ORGANISM="Paraphysomonas bandaiensis, Strain Caron Lab Isolate" /LENGTH=550 /DNA_ID=CAMNT_0027552149 /DNA_START=38 /DNA_END=1687 /DNA_ORIENTATION=+